MQIRTANEGVAGDGNVPFRVPRPRLSNALTDVTAFDTMQKHVPYHRVSTDRQGRSGLGLEAQQTAVGGEIPAAFTEIESGKKVDRPDLATAIALCKQQQGASSSPSSTASPATCTSSPA
jgi:hypothetical protein